MMKTMDRKRKALLISALAGILLLWFSVRAYDEFSAYSPSNNMPTVVGATDLGGDSAEQTVTEHSTETTSSGNVTETSISDASNETENSGNLAVTGDPMELSVTYNSTVSDDSTMISTGNNSTISNNNSTDGIIGDDETITVEDNSTITEGNDSTGTIIGDNSTETGSSDNSTGSNSTETSTDTTEDSDAYSFEFLPPLRNGKFALNSTIPVKFQLVDINDNYVSTSTASIMVDSAPGTASGSSNIDSLFRYDSENNQYIFNLSTNGMSTGSHIISVELDNGSTFSIAVELV